MQEAYTQAVAFFNEELKRGDKEQDAWWNESTSMSDVLEVVKKAKKTYESKATWRRSHGNTVWETLSSRIVYYDKILEVLVQHHPEYVALAWGAFKFLFVVSSQITGRASLLLNANLRLR